LGSGIFQLTCVSQQAQKEKRGVIFKRAESYVKEYRDAEREKIRLTRLSKQEGTYYVEAEPKLAFVVRIKGYVTHLQSISLSTHPSRRPLPLSIFATLLTVITPASTKSPPNPAKSSNSCASSKSTTESSSKSQKPPSKC